MSALAVIPGLIQPQRQARTLFWCVLASIGLHALVLLGMSRYDAPAPQSKVLLVLTAKLAPVAVAPPALAPLAQPEPAPQAQPALAPQPQPKPALAPQPQPKPAPAPQPQPKPAPAPQPQPKPAVPPEPVSAPSPASTKPAASPAPAPQFAAPAEPPRALQSEPAKAAPGSTASGTQSAAPIQARAAPQAPGAVPATQARAKSGSEVDAGTLEQYRLALIVATRRYKRYPAIALEKGWEGRVEVHMVIGANGMLASASIKSSSGHEILDHQALDMLKKGKTTIQIPAGLRGREFSIDVPVIFNLERPNS